jgi:hypothetical protein
VSDTRNTVSVTDRQRLESWYRRGCTNPSVQLDFGRKMPFGKYRNTAVYILIVKHPRYMDWILENTNFHLNEDEKWLKYRVDMALECASADNLIFGLRSQMGLGGVDNMENPHWIVE